MRTPEIKKKKEGAGTATFFYWDDDGNFVVELYDHSSKAEEHFGNDIAYLLTIKGKDCPELWSRLKHECQTLSGHDRLDLAKMMRHKFNDYFKAKRWLESENIDFDIRFDSRA